MNNRFLIIAPLLASSSFFLAGCSEDNSSFETPNTSGTPTNDNLISQNNFTILADPVDPGYLDPATGNYTAVTSVISVQIGDNNNQLITGPRLIQFRTEWGLIDPSCTTTEEGSCSVTWRSGSPDTMPANLRNSIVAYSVGGQESFGDINGNGIFDDGDIFNTVVYADVEEPFVNVDESNNGTNITFTTGDIVIDTINGLDPTGVNTTHDSGDGLFNGPNCAHSTLCSTTQATVTVWEGFSQLLNGGVVYSVGGTVTGLTGTLVIQNGGSDITFTADGAYAYSVVGGLTYNITVKTQPAGQTCTVSGGSGTATADVANVDIICT
jgi:hypothetical protein